MSPGPRVLPRRGPVRWLAAREEGHAVPKMAPRIDAMGQFGRITAISDLPPKATLAKVLKAATFQGFSPSRRRECVEWIVEARSGETRGRRLAQAIAWMAEGKSRNWKYEKC